MNLKNLSDDQLHATNKNSANAEREATITLLHHLCETQKRRLFAKYGCDSLFDYCVRELKMSEGHAARRINASRVLSDCPEIELKLNSGMLTVTAVSQAQTFFRKEKEAGVLFSKAEKSLIIKDLEAKPTREVERILISKATNHSIVKETVRAVSESFTELNFAADAETLSHLNRLKEIWSHEMPNASYASVIKKMAKLCRKKFDPMIKAERQVLSAAPAPESKSAAQKQTRYIPAAVRHFVWKRDRGVCSYVEGKSGRACGSRHRLQMDHIKPFASGGSNEPGNLRLRCFAHNQLHAMQSFGRRVLEFGR